MKRKNPETTTPAKSSTPKRRRLVVNEVHSDEVRNDFETTPSRKQLGKKSQIGSSGGKTQKSKATPDKNCDDGSGSESGSPTPKANGALPSTSSRKVPHRLNGAQSNEQDADKSAKRKSTRALLETKDTEDWEGETDLARDILRETQESDQDSEEDDTVTVNVQEGVDIDGTEPGSTSAETPSRKRGRPKGSKTKRSPTPEGDLAPEEKYFWQNRPGPPQVSSNSLAALKLLTHEEYFEEIAKYKDHHEPDMRYLMRLHARSFPQWDFELSQGYNICLYGYGSKRKLIHRFAEWLSRSSNAAPRIVVVNGYTVKLNIRTVISTIASIVTDEDRPLRLVGQPQEMLDVLLSHLSALPQPERLIVMINSLDGPSMRRGTTHAVLARLAAHPRISVVASVDTTTSTLMWNSTLKDQFGFVFHDCTTFAPYDAEFSVVDEVNDLLGRKGRRIGGKEGINYVLQSLPENARSLYRVLLAELFALMADGGENFEQDEFDVDGDDGARTKRHSEDTLGVEYRTLYQKASEEFICSSDMNFRFLLKEFHDHQMITTTRDASGAELLSVPLTREEMEAVLEDLVIG